MEHPQLAAQNEEFERRWEARRRARIYLTTTDCTAPVQDLEDPFFWVSYLEHPQAKGDYFWSTAIIDFSEEAISQVGWLTIQILSFPSLFLRSQKPDGYDAMRILQNRIDRRACELAVAIQVPSDWDRTLLSIRSAKPHEAKDIFRDAISKLDEAMRIDPYADMWLRLGLVYYVSWTLAKYRALICFRKIVECYQEAVNKGPENEDDLCGLDFAAQVLLILPIDLDIQLRQTVRACKPAPINVGVVTATDSELVMLGREKGAVFDHWGYDKEKKRKKYVLKIGVMFVAVSAMTSFLLKKG